MRLLIPVYSETGKHVVDMDVETLDRDQRFEVFRNRRGHAKRAQMRPLSCHTVPLMPGGNTQSFEQLLPCGQLVWTLTNANV